MVFNKELDDIFTQQRVFKEAIAKKMNIKDFEDISVKNRLNLITEEWRNLCIEFGEFLSLFPFKRKKENNKYLKMNIEKYIKKNNNEILYEYIDMFIFVMNIGLWLGLDGEKVRKLFFEKLEKNVKRYL